MKSAFVPSCRSCPRKNIIIRSYLQLWNAWLNRTSCDGKCANCHNCSSHPLSVELFSCVLENLNFAQTIVSIAPIISGFSHSNMIMLHTDIYANAAILTYLLAYSLIVHVEFIREEPWAKLVRCNQLTSREISLPIRVKLNNLTEKYIFAKVRVSHSDAR